MSALAITPNLETDEVAIELEALFIARVIRYRPKSSFGHSYLSNYLNFSTLSPGRLEHLRTRIVALCNFAKPTK